MLTWLDNLWRGRHRRRKHAATVRRLDDSLWRTALYLAAIFCAHTVAMVTLESMPLGDALWLTLTTATTVGYGDVSASTLWGRVATATLLYAGGIFVLAKLAGDYFEYRAERRERMVRGEWEWGMRDHIVIINAPELTPVQYFQRLIEQFRASPRFAETPIQILTDHFPNGLPAGLTNYPDVVHYHGLPHSEADLLAVEVCDAVGIVVLSASEHDAACDAQTFDTLHRLRALGTTAPVLAESVRDENRARLHSAGANAVIRPVRAYPGMVVRGLGSPGVEQVMEELFRSGGGEYRRFVVDVEDVVWHEVVTALLSRDLGTAVAYEDRHGNGIQTSPPAAARIGASAVFVLTRSAESDTEAQIAAALAALK
ncbi:MAG: ion channel [Pseudomonadota bacterium]